MALTQTFKYRDEWWTKYPAKSGDAFAMGVDLGQSQDHTAIVVMRHTCTPLDTWKPDYKTHRLNQNVEERFDVVHAERLPLGTSYPAVVGHVDELLARQPLSDGCDLVIDESGVGRAVGDLVEAAGLNPTRVTITAGSDAVREKGRWHVSKSLLVSGVDAALHSGELRFAAELQEASALAEELKEFRRHTTAAGRALYQARAGRHDDLVLAVALCIWWARERLKHRVIVSFY